MSFVSSAAEPSDWLEVESIDLEGQGVARNAQGKVVFIDGALAGERVRVLVHRSKSKWDQGRLVEISRQSALRVRPACPHFGLHHGACGGCKVQHLEPSAQLAVKQRVLEDSLAHLAKVRADRILRPIEGPSWGYRHRARLSVRHVAAKGQVLVGFHERNSRYVADMQSCSVLPQPVSRLLMPLRQLISSLKSRDRLPQIELALGEGENKPQGSPHYALSTALVLRHLVPLPQDDLQKLRDFAQAHPDAGIRWWLQPAGPDSAHRLDGGAAAGMDLVYRLTEFDVVMPFKPTDFTQVNAAVNRVMVSRALGMLEPQPHERVIDWFCGLGNFSLPLARRAGEVLGIEGSPALVERASANAALNGCSERASFACRNLFDITAPDLPKLGIAQAWLVDPPREGALALCKALADATAPDEASPFASLSRGSGWRPPRRIVYVSCNPATLARDAGVLVHQAGYRCSSAGVINMFPQTAHVESMAVFEHCGA